MTTLAIKEWVLDNLKDIWIELPDDNSRVVFYNKANWDIFRIKIWLSEQLNVSKIINWKRVNKIVADLVFNTVDTSYPYVIINHRGRLQILNLINGKKEDIDTIDSIKNNGDWHTKISLDSVAWIVQIFRVNYSLSNTINWYNLKGKCITDDILKWFEKIYWNEPTIASCCSQWNGWFTLEKKQDWITSSTIYKNTWINIDPKNNITSENQIFTNGSSYCYKFPDTDLFILWWTKYLDGKKEIEIDCKWIFSANWKKIYPIWDNGIILNIDEESNDLSHFIVSDKILILDKNDWKYKIIQAEKDWTIKEINSDFKKSIEDNNWNIFKITNESINLFSKILGNNVWFSSFWLNNKWLIEYDTLFNFKWESIFKDNKDKKDITIRDYIFPWIYKVVNYNKNIYNISLYNSEWKLLTEENISILNPLGKDTQFSIVNYLRNGTNFSKDFLKLPSTSVVNKRELLIPKDSIFDEVEIVNNKLLKIWEKEFLSSNFPWDWKTKRTEVIEMWDKIEIKWKKYLRKLLK
jgi:hypothetical protein